MRTREPASFWRENVVAVVIPPRECRSGGNKLSRLEVLSFCGDRERVKPLFIKITVLIFLEKKNVKQRFQGCLFLRIREKTLSQISFLKSSSSSNLTVSLGTTTTTRYRVHGVRKLIVPLEKTEQYIIFVNPLLSYCYKRAV